MVKHWKRLLSCTLAAGMLLFAGCRDHGGSEDEPDPYAGMVEVPYGTEGTVWTKLQEGVPVSSFTAGQFEADGQYIRYTGTDYTAVTGVDVSEHQRDIDWQQAADAGISFAMIRAGYRGSTAGSLYTDPYFFENMTGASAAGLDIGVYFFSQATTKAEAVAARIRDIHPTAILHPMQATYDAAHRDLFFPPDCQYDYIVDAIDLVSCKLDLAETARRLFVEAAGMGHAAAATALGDMYAYRLLTPDGVGAEDATPAAWEAALTWYRAAVAGCSRSSGKGSSRRSDLI